MLCCVSETADREQLAQVQILNKAQQRQIEDLERKLEDSRRNMRYIEHQFAIAKGFKYNIEGWQYKETEIQEQVDSQVAIAKAAWEEELDFL
ncbi:hypothetical protein F7725_023048 [Dissostichus mawsoni]|uniref:Uncharacterized protein n=1 Tax=Dissostichus mawsoni TaxID=36200 RepID=A0A7J5Z0J6_DISMA|nr:hypothetical protein F7725_023048 [Dissostichus mawsoni]